MSHQCVAPYWQHCLLQADEIDDDRGEDETGEEHDRLETSANEEEETEDN